MAHSYLYRAVDGSGAVRSGELVCASRSGALDTLNRQGLVPVELREGVASAPPREKRRLPSLRIHSGRASARELLAFTQSLAALLNAGLTIDRTLQISAALAPGAAARALCEKLLKAVRSGRTLSEAVEGSGQVVPTYYISMINAGEVGGSLAVTLTRLGELMRRELEVRERIQSALVYPAMLAAVVLFTLVVLLTFVLPRFETLFAESEAPLPVSTRAVLGVGRFVADYWWAMLASLFAITAGAATWLRTVAGRAQFDRWVLKSRLTMGLPGATNAARLLRTLSTLGANGLPLPAALRIARGTLANRHLLEGLAAVAAAVQAGQSFSEALSRVAAFPAVAAQLARVGEETGKLDEMLLSAALVLEEETQLKIERLLSLFVPLLTVAMGVIVAALIGSVLIGLLSINDLAF
jgi:general secretion pathway protein F